MATFATPRPDPHPEKMNDRQKTTTTQSRGWRTKTNHSLQRSKLTEKQILSISPSSTKQLPRNPFVLIDPAFFFQLFSFSSSYFSFHTFSSQPYLDICSFSLYTPWCARFLIQTSRIKHYFRLPPSSLESFFQFAFANLCFTTQRKRASSYRVYCKSEKKHKQA